MPSDHADRAGSLRVALLVALGTQLATLSPLYAQRFDGFNVIVAPGHPFGSVSAERSLVAAKRLGATSVAIIPFLWQASQTSSDILRGDDMPDGALRQAIRQAKTLGFSVVVKPHVWVPERWAGAVEPDSEHAWRVWFARYRDELTRIAVISDAEGADVLSIGTELAKTTQRPEWAELIAATRATFPRTLTYIAHNMEEAETVPFWHLLDMIGVSLYPPLGADNDRVGRRLKMRNIADQIDDLSRRIGKPVLVGEIGLRSARCAAAKPWESAEERKAAAAPELQADVLADWLSALDRPAVRGVLVWRWITDPDVGGPADTDFTVQGKRAEAVLRCTWTADCRPNAARRNQILNHMPRTTPFSCSAFRPQ